MSAKYTSMLSQLYHLAAFTLAKPRMQLDNGRLIVSVDVDVGSKELGVRNKGENDANVNDYLSERSVGEIEEQALPLIISFFNDLEIPVTFAVRGQLTEVSDSILELLVESPLKHDIGSHGYYHRDFRTLSRAEAETELSRISVAMKKLNVLPRSFVFPKNGVAHLSLLQKFGYRCYRSLGNFTKDGMYIRKHNQLYDIHPSFYLGQSSSPAFLDKIIDIAIRNRLPFHVWFHPWDLGRRKESISRSITRVFSPLFQYAKKKERNGTLLFETMLSMAESCDKLKMIDTRAPKTF